MGVMPRILVMDDDDMLRPVLRDMLVYEGYEVIEAADGNQGMKACREMKADLVISDVIMPEKEGLEVIRELRRDFPHVKIIAMSGGGQIGALDYLTLAKKMGAHGILAKPFGRDELIAAVQSLLAEK